MNITSLGEARFLHLCDMRSATRHEFLPRSCAIRRYPRGMRCCLSWLKDRIQKRAHALVVVAEGAGQKLFEDSATDRDASGNIKLKDIGLYLRERIESYFREANIPIVMRRFGGDRTTSAVRVGHHPNP